MELRIEPTAELTVKLKNQSIGRLEALCLDTDSGGLLGIPKVKLCISINAASFAGDQKTFDAVVKSLAKFKFLDIVIKK